MKITVNNEEQILEVINAFLFLTEDIKVFFLYGDLGAGKTTFVKHLVKYFGTEDEISSPTYSLINEYNTSEGRLYHMDLYRLNDLHEALDIGIEDYLYSGSYCLIEWPELIEGIVEKAIAIRIEALDDGSRIFEIELPNT